MAGQLVTTPAALGRYLLAVAIGLDVTLNALAGGRPYQTVSCRVGLSIQTGGWAAGVPWPAPMRVHFLGSVFITVV